MKQAVTIKPALLGLPIGAPLRAEWLKPFVLADIPPGDMAAVADATRSALARAGFEVVGGYAPYPIAAVIAATHVDLKVAAGRAKNGEFGAAR